MRMSLEYIYVSKYVKLDHKEAKVGVVIMVITHFHPFSEWSFPKSNFPHEKSIFPNFENLIHALSKNILCSIKTYCCYLIFVSV